jgi:hypothetical protein
MNKTEPDASVSVSCAAAVLPAFWVTAFSFDD